jgi:hypothetical protein
VIAKGKLGTIEFDGEWVTLNRSALSPTGKIRKRVHVSSIGSIQPKPATLVTNGFLKLGISGDVNQRTRFGNQGMRTMYDENAIAFARRHEPEFQAVAAAIEKAILRLHAVGPPN